jgi:hypothetical protein
MPLRGVSRQRGDGAVVVRGVALAKLAAVSSSDSANPGAATTLRGADGKPLEELEAEGLASAAQGSI